MRAAPALLAAALAAAACVDPPVEPAPEPPLTLAVEFAGCSAVHAGPACELPADRVVRLWVKAPADASIAVHAGAAPRSSAGSAVEGGTLFPVEVPDGAADIVVEAARGASRTSFRLALAPREDVPSLDAAEALRREGKLDEAERGLAAHLSDDRPAVVARATGKLARIARARGQIDRAVELFRDALGRDRAAGRVSDEFSDRFALAYTLLYGGRRFGEAREVLAGLGPIEASYPEGRAAAPYYRGLAAYETGDLRAALRLFREAAAAAARLGLEEQRLDVLQPWAGTLALLGRHTEAEARLREAEAALPARAGPCRRAHLLNDMGWLALRGAGSPGERAARAIPILERARALYGDACAEGADRSNVLTNLALAEIERGAFAEAQRLVGEARRADPRPGARIEVWWSVVEGRAALAAGKADVALNVYQRLGAIGQSAMLLEARLEAALGRAQALEALGRDEPALRAYVEAEALLDEGALLAPLGEGRETFLARHERGTRLLVDFLVRRAQRVPEGAARIAGLREAAAAARRGRARMLASLAWVERLEALPPADRATWESALAAYRRMRASLDEQAAGDWRLARDRLAAVTAARRTEHDNLRAALDHAIAAIPRAPAIPRPDGAAIPRAPAPPRPDGAALPEPGEGELILVYHPIRDGWVGLAIGRERAAARAIGAVDPAAPPERLAEQLLAPFRDALVAPRRIRFAAGALDRRDLHALPWDGRPLVALAPVVYGLDLPRARRAETPAGAPALVVADSRGDLPLAHEEAQRVAGSLRRRGIGAEILEDRAATHGAVTAALARPGLSLLHYTGHAWFEGRDGWESGLPLAAGGTLTLGDVMALPSAPRRVVLSGCDTARSAGAASVEGLGLAQAFAVAGADEVIAATRPVRDQLAARIAAALHDGVDGGPPGDLAEALRAAQLAAAAADPAFDWASFRALVP